MKDLKEYYASHQQEQVFQFADELSPDALASLQAQAAEFDLPEIERLAQELVRGGGSKNEDLAGDLVPAEFTPLPVDGADASSWDKAVIAGEEALRAGRVCAFTVAGGQGTRLGYSGPKGTFGVTPVLKKSLFQVFAEKILAASRKYETSILWFILTSKINHAETVRFFEECDFFGLDSEQVQFITQGVLPAVDESGKILLSGKGEIAVSPDGHGGSLRALVRSGAIDRMEEAGADIISYFQVDNPLVRCIDPAFIGFHVLENSELSSKALPKAYPEEKVGVFCERDGQAVVIEYSDMPERLVNERDSEGEIRFRAGSIAIHIFDREFVRSLGAADSASQLPFHVAHKKVPFVDGAGVIQNPEDPNGYKFEMFVFDALPFAKNPVIIETARADDFSPVKNAKGVDSVETCREDQLRQFARWTKAAGIELEVDETGLPAVCFEISPLFAIDEESFCQSWNQLDFQPEIADGLVIS